MIGDRIRLDSIPGSATVIDAGILTESRVFTINEALRKVPGVFARDEEGLGLRPNLGIRGLNPTRSSKVLLLEDGIPIAYAPYGDNATLLPPAGRALRAHRGPEGLGPDRLRTAHGRRGDQLHHAAGAGRPRRPARRLVRQQGLPRDPRPGGRHLRRHRLHRARHLQGNRRRARQHALRGRRREPEGRARPRRAAGRHLPRELLRRDFAGDVLGAHARRVAGRPVPEPVQERRDGRAALRHVGHAPLRAESRGDLHDQRLLHVLQPRLVAAVEQFGAAPERCERPGVRRHGESLHDVRQRRPPAPVLDGRPRAARNGGARAVRRRQRHRGGRPLSPRGPVPRAGERRHARPRASPAPGAMPASARTATARSKRCRLSCRTASTSAAGPSRPACASSTSITSARTT